MLRDSPSNSSRRLSYLLGLPMGVAAFGSSMLLEAPSAQATPYDAVALPLMTLLLTALFVAFVLKKQNFLVLEATLLASLGLHFGGKLAYILGNQETISFIALLLPNSPSLLTTSPRCTPLLSGCSVSAEGGRWR